jgi:hypothetical protein
MGVFNRLSEVKRPVSASGAADDAAGTAFEPVRGVSLEMFADIAQVVAARHDDDSQGVVLATARGIQPGDWEVAAWTWNARIADNADVRERLSELCRADTG